MAADGESKTGGHLEHVRMKGRAPIGALDAGEGDVEIVRVEQIASDYLGTQLTEMSGAGIVGTNHGADGNEAAAELGDESGASLAGGGGDKDFGWGHEGISFR